MSRKQITIINNFKNYSIPQTHRYWVSHSHTGTSLFLYLFSFCSFLLLLKFQTHGRYSQQGSFLASLTLWVSGLLACCLRGRQLLRISFHGQSTITNAAMFFHSFIIKLKNTKQTESYTTYFHNLNVIFNIFQRKPSPHCHAI